MALRLCSTLVRYKGLVESIDDDLNKLETEMKQTRRAQSRLEGYRKLVAMALSMRTLVPCTCSLKGFVGAGTVPYLFIFLNVF